MMTKTYSLLCIIGIVLFIESCCTKVHCSGFEELNSIRFDNFSPGDMDSIYLAVYEHTPNGLVYIDSTADKTYINQTNSGSYYFYFDDDINVNRIYKLYLRPSNLSYTIDNFDTYEVTCNSCIAGSDNFPMLSSYSINGQNQQAQELIITK